MFDDSLGPVARAFKGAECISYLATGYKSSLYGFNDTADMDGFVSTYNNYLQWDVLHSYTDGRAVQVRNSACPSDVPYCTANIKNLDASETYVLSIANGYDDQTRQQFGKINLAYIAGTGGAPTHSASCVVLMVAAIGHAATVIPMSLLGQPFHMLPIECVLQERRCARVTPRTAK